jgi:hypothetical protein
VVEPRSVGEKLIDPEDARIGFVGPPAVARLCRDVRLDESTGSPSSHAMNAAVAEESFRER